MLTQLERSSVEDCCLTWFSVCLEIMIEVKASKSCGNPHCHAQIDHLYFCTLNTPFLLWV